ncbi:hypothetical protein [Planomicrobium okeanokoites]|uniref:Uncharacterized protein n=1 Tax=Planomicrobium okeanokoites TaxID=244 RepID=A0ABV7KMQ6_PLAOK|nr:hypothetical protein [Planomicrobium okeanokoites]TAA66732.1 hypothetical protein D2910_14565 [Planomicrobium okeanokoites]
MSNQKVYNLNEVFIKEAAAYAELSKAYTADRHDFHQGGLENKRRKMYEGKLGEKIFKTFLVENSIPFAEDQSSHTEADSFDFILPNGVTIDVKTRTKSFHTRTLELVHQFARKPKDIYVSVRLFDDLSSGKIIGWCTKEDILNINRVENNGYLDNYVIFDNELRDIKDFLKIPSVKNEVV